MLPEEPTTAQATGMLIFTSVFFLFGAWALAGAPLTGSPVCQSMGLQEITLKMFFAA